MDGHAPQQRFAPWREVKLFVHRNLPLPSFGILRTRGGGVPYYRNRAELGLTRRQQQLVSFVAKGWTNKEIASTLHLSEQTVKNHMHRILRQVNAGDRYQAAETIRSFGLLS